MTSRKESVMVQKYICMICDYVYDPTVGDPEGNIPPGTPFEALPDEWECPDCGVGKENFEPYEEID